MSLLSLLANGSRASTTDTTLASIANARIGAVKAAARIGTTALGGAAISTDARIAAATLADARKDGTTLEADVRAALRTGTAQSVMSNRALSAIIVGEGFDSTDKRAAVAEMKARDRAAILSIIDGGLTVDALAAWQAERAATNSAMSVEEKAARAAGHW